MTHTDPTTLLAAATLLQSRGDMCRAYDSLLAGLELPGGSADELWPELHYAWSDPSESIALTNPMVPPQWIRDRTADEIKQAMHAVRAFSERWEAMESCVRDLREWLRPRDAGHNAADSAGLRPALVAAMQAALERLDKDDRPLVRRDNAEPIQNADAIEACRLLIRAYRNGAEAGGSVDWEDVNEAHAQACKALGEKEEG